MLRKTIAVFALLSALPVCAQEVNTPYAGFGFLQAHMKRGCAGIGVAPVACEDKDSGWKLLAGYKFTRNWSVEGGYVDFGRVREIGAGAQANIDTTALEASVLGALPVTPELSVFGRLGGYRSRAELSNAATGKKSTSNITFGVGVQYDFGRHVGLRAEWQRYQNVKARNDATGAEMQSDISAFGASLVWRFF
ncbi:MAG: outer membrane beta-barrel protein [Betaproteobacteria bacterium]